MNLPRKVKIVEMGPRDGLQNEREIIPAPIKIELINKLTLNGFAFIEVGSFVSPKWIPQMADTEDVMAGIRRKSGVVYSVLVPNMKGFEGALLANAGEIAIFGAASEKFSKKNINCTIDESLARFEPVCEAFQYADMFRRF
jgi:hydroxymethylglutaryl-CoA lyase